MSMSARKPRTTGKPLGRPTSYNDELGAAICEGIAAGMSLKSICEQPGMPMSRTVFLWLAKSDEPRYANFLPMYTRAKEQQADAMTEDMLAIADDEGLDPNARRIRVDTRKWLASKLKPKKYGDRLDQTIEHVGADVAERLADGRKRLQLLKKQA